MSTTIQDGIITEIQKGDWVRFYDDHGHLVIGQVEGLVHMTSYFKLQTTSGVLDDARQIVEIRRESLPLEAIGWG